MNLAQRISQLTPQQRKLLELKLKEKNVDRWQIPITRISRADHEGFPLSFGQERLWFLDQLEPGTPVYNIVKATRLDGPLNKEILEKSIQEIVRRHDIFRTIFIKKEGNPVQAILPELSIPLRVLDFKRSSKEKQDAEIKQYLQQESQQSFDLARGPLLKPQLLELAEHEHIFLLLTHHIIADGTSVQVFLKELVQLYEAFSQERQSPLPELAIQYIDYTCWQRDWFQTGTKECEWQKKQEEYWLEQFAGGVPALALPLDYPRPLMQSFAGNSAYFTLDSQETNLLKEAALKMKVTMYVMLLAVFNIVLAKLSGQTDIIIGTPVAGRHHKALQDLIGMFVNTLALRNRPEGDKSVGEFLAEVKNCALKAFENQEYRYEDIVNKVNVDRNTGRNPLFDVMLSLENLETPGVRIPGLKLKEYDFEVQTSKFDLTLIAREEEGTLQFSCEYCTKLFKEETILRYIGYFKQALYFLLKNKDFTLKIAEIEILTEEERKRLLVEFNNTETPYPQDKVVHELFADHVEKVPDHIAVIFEEKKLSYRELNEQSNRLAKNLIERGVSQGAVVGICAYRRPELITAIFAVLKAGAVYLPLDPNHPEKRLTYMLKAGSATVVLTDNRVLSGTGFSLLELDDEASYKSSRTRSNVLIAPGDPAYLLYTSGTTGLPKGVLIEHRSVVNLMKSMTDIIDFKTSDRVLSLTTIAFDIFVMETLVPLSRGCAVAIGTGEQQLDPGAAARVFLKETITIFQLTPSRLQLFLSASETAKSFQSLRYLIVGGENFPGGILEYLKTLLHTDGRVFNLYAPTETTIYSIGKDLTGERSVTIGKPIANTVVYILDNYLKPVPLGVWGQIYIGGRGVARGYLNNPELTAEKFIDFHYSSFIIHRSRLYGTGDLGRWLPNGDIECSGRIDHQVKIRGFRIELAEIEKRLLQHEMVKEAVVTARLDEHSNKYICAYYVPTGEENVEIMPVQIEELRNFLALELPDYMIPSYFIPLAEIPLTVNRKIDHLALPDPVGKRAQLETPFLAPQSELERQIAAQWLNVLNIDKVGIHDNFFKLGGNSMKIIQLNNRLKEALNREITVVSMFRHLTVSSLAQYLSEKGNEEAAAAKEEQNLLRVAALDRGKNIFKQTLNKTKKANSKH
ncbi:MAG TPA: amino acid adenylation domain-containing protein [Candidatus Deferrimicrobium sp.]|nr:amino acid adenylation domain-containing protein [Candidatus Deferrimicrobium sp.]